MRHLVLARTKPRIVTPCCSHSVARSSALVQKAQQHLNRSQTRAASAPSTTKRHETPFRMAVIGSGPAGFYTAYHVMSRIENAKVDMFEALPVPFGLVRFGVAPDHPEVKNCQDKFNEVAASPNFRFVGNVSIDRPSNHHGGATIPLSALLSNYHAVVFAYGAIQDRTLGILGEDQKGVYSAREFVGWYNGLPEHAGLDPDLTQGEEAVIIGQGNVALDVARMLLQDVDVLRKTDIAEHAVEALSRSRIKRVHIVGRRGPMQAAFTIKELRELVKLDRVALHPVDASLVPNPKEIKERPAKRLMDLLLKASPVSPAESSKSWSLDFCLSPTQFISSPEDPSRLSATEFHRTILSNNFDPKANVQGISNETITMPSSVAFRSIGYKSVPLPSFSSLGIEFDEHRGILRNDGLGRVAREVRTTGAAMAQEHFKGLYCAGWVKRGPTGVIASTMEDAFITGQAVVEDWHSGAEFLSSGNEEGSGSVFGWDGVAQEVSVGDARILDWQDWQKIDKAEREKGQLKGKEREKLPTTAAMLSVVS
ncbi:hypothetical protein MCOR27_007434 [Pyricularia oryzae]|uniref:NADPH:adrenodoxin oxidoreductase, mitochondrial n=3 Tax=Pyricularia TaxID=48558 RepID=A0ABQ8N9M0_PYRGI|nr:NADPH:adrenodoxin oxidoreductase [Pyricularia oryzae 70-15]KAH8839138.1 hypothetical protein MCOR01_008361 [Pyricularia oryzae]KAI6293130.1 hypothetical protein MCOR33_009349 [Pyricularia grisea]EHA54908.1 NADPH:adrenodoxin oxidoreductase [Pyricularia oryzae 70-15]KAH9438980.1 hypothetical protein MCOR02_002563 [Pyricularia oryzae]KAI6267095.1 hypothetical protein MCOR26_009858 [Pyricularia oryzae]